MASKFSGFLDNAKGRAEEELSAPPAPPAEPKRKPAPPSPAPSPPARETSEERRGPGRPPGKKSSREYSQVTIYILGETHRAVKRALLDGTGRKDFSQVVEEALQQWLRAQS
jgi:hypothetical protein